MKTKSQFKAGMFLLETLTSGMYNDPLAIYREYIQNAVDSIDALESSFMDGVVVEIDLDPFNKSIRIFDNGSGVSTKKAEKVLSSIGSSEKMGSSQRGFRGIGRLGGIAFSEVATFRTKVNGEKFESIQKWDCIKLKELLTNPDHAKMSLEEVFGQVAQYKKVKSKLVERDSYFEVLLEGVQSFRNHIFDLHKIKKYISEVAPVPFDPNFSFGEKVTEHLQQNLSSYKEYKVMVNGEQVYKPYQDTLAITSKGRLDEVSSVRFFNIENNGRLLATGWHGLRRDLLGAIRKGSGVAGIRVRAGNILIGDSHYLDHCFRENRFNSYVLGEIHINSSKLIPNSRRDDFVDNHEKGILFNTIERDIGLPVSKEIRNRSRISSQEKPKNGKKNKAPQEIKDVEETYVMDELSTELSMNPSQKLLSKVLESCKGCEKLKAIISAENLN